MQLHPLADRIVAKTVEPETKTASGFLLTEQAKDQTRVAEVMAIGKDVKEVKVGDKIVHSEFGPDRFKDGAVDMIIVREKDILAVIKEK